MDVICVEPPVPRLALVRTRKTERYQIINRFKKFESCLNRLDVQVFFMEPKGSAAPWRPICARVREAAIVDMRRAAL
jgi:hypothetical protein